MKKRFQLIALLAVALLALAAVEKTKLPLSRWTKSRE